MTEEEKKRVDELLNENDYNENDELKIEFDGKEQVQIVNYNPSEVVLAPGSGFLPTKMEEERLKQIDSRLDSRNFSRLLTGSRSTMNNVYTVSPSLTNSSSSMAAAVDSDLYRNMLV